MDKGLNELWFRRGQLPSVGSVDGNVAKGRRAVVLNIDVGGSEKLD